MGPVTYEVYHPEKKKPKQSYHVNLLKEWKDQLIQAPGEVLLAQRVDSEEEVEMGPETPTSTAAPVLAHLGPEQAAELLQVFKGVPSLLSAGPGKTTLVEHVIHLKDG